MLYLFRQLLLVVSLVAAKFHDTWLIDWIPDEDKELSLHVFSALYSRLPIHSRQDLTRIYDRVDSYIVKPCTPGTWQLRPRRQSTRVLNFA